MSSQSQLQARRLLLIQYSSRLPLRSSSFQWPNDDLLLSIQSHILQDIGIGQQVLPLEVDSPENDHGLSRNGSNTKRRRADRQYEKSFFKALISRLEEAVRSHQSEIPGEEDEEVSNIRRTLDLSRLVSCCTMCLCRYLLSLFPFLPSLIKQGS